MEAAGHAYWLQTPPKIAAERDGKVAIAAVELQQILAQVLRGF